MTHFKDLSQAHTIVYLKKYNSKIPTFTPNLLNQNIESLSTLCRLQENKMFKKWPPLVASQYRYHKLRKAFSKFYRRHFDLVSKYNVGLKTVLRQSLSEPEFYGDLMYKFRKIIGKYDFPYHFKKIIVRYKK